MANRGMMADNMFVGKQLLLNWLNSSLQLRLEKVEDTCNGAVACQLMDCLHPGSVNMRKVDFNVKNDYEFVGNYKELQQAFTKLGVDRAFAVNSLSKGKFQDNNEFIQWFKGYWDHVTGGQEVSDYDAVGRRQQSKTGDWKKFSAGDAGARPAPGSIPAVRRAGPAPAAPRGSAASKAAMPRAAAAARATHAAAAPAALASQLSVASSEELEQYQQQVDGLTEQLTELKLKVDTVERERDFYFDKLRDIEILCQAPELQGIPVVKVVERILYAADSEEAKAAMTEVGALPDASMAAAEELVA